MTLKGFAINLSNLIWTDEVEKACINRSVFMMQDMMQPQITAWSEEHKRFWIYCGSEMIEYGYIRYAAYLAVVTREGKYRLERLEKYLEERDGLLVLDVLSLPEEINGVQFQKAQNFQNTPWEREFNLPSERIMFHAESDDPDTWTIEGWSTVTFVIGPNSTGKSHFIAEQFKDRGYSVLDVLDYQRRADQDVELKWNTSWERVFQANEWLKDDMVELVRQGKDVVVEQTFFRALRRIGYVEAIRDISKTIPVEVYVMMPSEEQLRQNCMKRWGYTQTELEWDIKRTKRELEQIFEFPNPAEGFSKIYIVSDDSITLRMDEPDWSLPQRAHEELQEEAKERAKAKEESEQRKRRLKEEGERLERLLKEAAQIRNGPEGILPSDDVESEH